MIVVALLLFIMLWNDFLQQFKGSLGADWSKIMCATCMSFVPGIIFYMIGQKYFIEGIVMTGMKGLSRNIVVLSR